MFESLFFFFSSLLSSALLSCRLVREEKLYSIRLSSSLSLFTSLFFFRKTMTFLFYAIQHTFLRSVFCLSSFSSRSTRSTAFRDFLFVSPAYLCHCLRSFRRHYSWHTYVFHHHNHLCLDSRPSMLSFSQAEWTAIKREFDTGQTPWVVYW